MQTMMRMGRVAKTRATYLRGFRKHVACRFALGTIILLKPKNMYRENASEQSRMERTYGDDSRLPRPRPRPELPYHARIVSEASSSTQYELNARTQLLVQYKASQNKQKQNTPRIVIIKAQLSTRVPLQLESLPKWAIELHAKDKGNLRNVEVQTCLNTKSKDETNTKLGMVIHYNLNR